MRQFGWDPLLGVCGLSARAPRDRLVWQLTTQLFWTLLAVTATVVCALTTTVYLYRQKVRPPFLGIRDTRSPCSSRSALALSRIAPLRHASRTYRCSTATARRSGSSTAAQPRSRAIISRSTAHSDTSCCASVGVPPVPLLCVNPLTYIHISSGVPDSHDLAESSMLNSLPPGLPQALTPRSSS